MHRRDLPPFRDLHEFTLFLEAKGQLRRIPEPVGVVHEMTEIHLRVLAANGPALLFERPVKADGQLSAMPMLVNLFGTVERVAWGLGIQPEALPALGEMLAELREPQLPQGFADAYAKLPLLRAALNTRTRRMRSAPVQSVVLTGGDIDLARLPVQIPWPG